DVVPRLQDVAPAGQGGGQAADVGDQLVEAGGLDRLAAVLRNDVGHLEVVAPVDQHQADPGPDDERHALRVGRLPGEAEPQHVHRHAVGPGLEAQQPPDVGVAPVAGHGQPGPDLDPAVGAGR